MKSIIMFCVGFITGYVISKTRNKMPEEWDWEEYASRIYGSNWFDGAMYEPESNSTTMNVSGLK